jgi:DGQHR domain-containing protein
MKKIMSKVMAKKVAKKKSLTAKKTSPAVKPIVKKVKPKKRGKKKKKVLTEQEKEQNLQMKEVRNLMQNMGFSRATHVDGKEFVYDGRTSELDDIFFYENIIILTEYTIAGSPGSHLTGKKIIYDKIVANPQKFISFLLADKGFKPLQETFKKTITPKYSVNQLQVRVLYASKNAIAKEHTGLVPQVKIFKYSIAKYFESLSKVIKKSSKFEFFDFLDIPFSKIGANVKASSTSAGAKFSGHILPEEHSSFKEGYKLVSFYIDANSLIRRAYVLRKDGWKNNENIGHYQRMFLMKKIKSMRKYLNDEKRVFINNIIVTLPIEKIGLSDEAGNTLTLDASGNFKGGGVTNVTPATITIDDSSNIIGIVDGQHRCYAYHEGDDTYEKTIAGLRDIQNLLVTGILYPKNEPEEKRLNFEAQLFLEINSNQSGASSQLKQEIEFMRNPFSTISISKHIINQLNQSGPLATIFEEYWYETGKLKTASVISFGLRPLVKFDGNDSLFSLWTNPKKPKLEKKKKDAAALREYKEFCTTQVRDIFIGLKANIDANNWRIDRTDKKAILNVTTINGIINCLRLLIENKKTGSVDYYKKQLQKISGFDFKRYKSSQYRKMGLAIYDLCFK